jgi:hypothetical protein
MKDKETPMYRLPSLLFAAVLMTSSLAFAGDTPDPSGKGETALPSGSNAATPPTTPPAGTAADKVPDVATSGENPVATSPGDENKGKPPVAPQ